MYPRRKDLFVAWSKAMVEGATVDKPNYSPARTANKGRAKPQKGHQRRRRRKKGRAHGSKD